MAPLMMLMITPLGAGRARERIPSRSPRPAPRAAGVPGKTGPLALRLSRIFFPSQLGSRFRFSPPGSLRQCKHRLIKT